MGLPHADSRPAVERPPIWRQSKPAGVFQFSVLPRTSGRWASFSTSVTGLRPFTGSTPETIFRAIEETEPVPPRSLVPQIPPDLDLICRKCLAKNPASRYQTSRDLADDLERLLRRKPVSVRPYGRAERSYLWARRNPVIAGLVAIVLVAFGLVVWKWRDAVVANDQVERRNTELKERAEDIERQNEEIQRRATAEQAAMVRETLANAQAESARQEAARNEQAKYLNGIGLAIRYIQNGQPDVAERHLLECKDSLRHLEWHYLKRQVAHREKVSPVVLPSSAARACVAIDRRGRLATVDPTKRFEVDKPGEGGPERTVAVAPLPTRGIEVRDPGADRIGLAIPVGLSSVTALAFSADGRWLAAGVGPADPEAAATVRVWDASTGQEIMTGSGHRKRVNGLAFHPAKDLIASAGEDGTVRVWQVSTGREIQLLQGNNSRVRSVTFSPDGKQIVAADEDWIIKPAAVRIWETDTGREIAALMKSCNRSRG